MLWQLVKLLLSSADLTVFKMVTFWILKIQTFLMMEISTADKVRMVSMCHHAKFRGNQSNCCWDTAIYRFFKMVGIHHLGFLWQVFITVLDLFGIDAVVSIICKF